MKDLTDTRTILIINFPASAYSRFGYMADIITKMNMETTVRIKVN